MQILEKEIKAKEFMRLLNARMEMVTMQYHHAVSADRKIEAEAMAETKWQLAELKMQVVDFLIEDLEQINAKEKANE